MHFDDRTAATGELECESCVRRVLRVVHSLTPSSVVLRSGYTPLKYSGHPGQLRSSTSAHMLQQRQRLLEKESTKAKTLAPDQGRPKSPQCSHRYNSRVLRRASPRLEFSGSHFISFP